MDQFIWREKYRPQTVADCILPDRLKKLFLKYVSEKDTQIPDMLFFGPPGTGKTTIARALCQDLELDHLYINASRERGVDVVKHKMVSYASTMALGGGKKVLILDEADNLTQDAQLALRASIEEFSSNASFILTCNYKAKLIEALYSRCPGYDFTLSPSEKPKMAMEFCKRAIEILNKENVPYDKDVVIQLIKTYFPDYRRILGELQKASKLGPLDAGYMAQLSSIQKMDDLVKSLKNKDFSAMRKWVVLNLDIDASRIFRNIYDSLSDTTKPESIPQAVLIIAKYQYQSAFASDQEINLVAMLTEIMVECEFK